jgi:hypothetical protein
VCSYTPGLLLKAGQLRHGASSWVAEGPVKNGTPPAFSLVEIVVTLTRLARMPWRSLSESAEKYYHLLVVA